jgi:hypothetical protein
MERREMRKEREGKQEAEVLKGGEENGWPWQCWK